ncbi:MAG: hypothetical protein WCO45_16250 [Pseudanabaena sp. ELA607]
MNSIDIIQERVKQKKQKKFLLVANGIIIGVLIVWLAVGNLLVVYLEQPMLKAQTELVQKYPSREDNTALVKLRELDRKLERYNKLEPQKSIGYLFRDYYSSEILENHSNQTNNLPQDLKNYLDSHSTIINEIITLLKNEPLKFERRDLSKAFTDPVEFANTPVPSYLVFADLHRMLLVDALQQYQSGQTQKAFDILTAFCNINLALQEQGSLISQLVNDILYGDQLAFLRKTSLPIEVPQLAKPNHKKFFIHSIEFEALFIANFMQIPSSEIEGRIPSYEIEGMKKRSPSLIERLLLPFQIPYFKLSGIDYWTKNMQMLEKVQNQDISSFDLESLQKELKASLAWWNVSGRSQEIRLSQLRKPYKILLKWEFTQKILQAKAEALKTGKLPSMLQNSEPSSILKTLQYDYQVTDNGQKMTLQMRNPPKWYVVYKEGDLVTYSFTLNSIQPPK